jgi:hypothetical protein
MFQTTTIHDVNGTIKLSCFMENGEIDKDFVWLEFEELKDDEYPQFSLEWDNPEYLFNEFYQFLHRWKDRICKYEDQLEFKEVWNYFEEDEDIVPELIEMFDVALKQGWYEHK